VIFINSQVGIILEALDLEEEDTITPLEQIKTAPQSTEPPHASAPQLMVVVLGMYLSLSLAFLE